jgi:hypothetical protein
MIRKILLAATMLAVLPTAASAQSPTLTQVYGPASVPPGCRQFYCPGWGPPVPPLGTRFYAPDPPLAYGEPPPPPPLAYTPSVPLPEPIPGPAPALPPPPPMGWVYGPYLICGRDAPCVVSVDAAGLNVRIVPNGPAVSSLANGVPVAVVGQSGNWVAVAPVCPLAPTYAWSITAGVPLMTCL